MLRHTWKGLTAHRLRNTGPEDEALKYALKVQLLVKPFLLWLWLLLLLVLLTLMLYSCNEIDWR
jgi:hypothetical protein